MNRALARTLKIAAGVTALTLGTVAFIHTSTGDAIASGLVRIAHGGCPFGYDQAMNPRERERARVHFAAEHRGETAAASRPALGFTLDHTTRPQIVARMSAYGVRCSRGQGMSDLTCLHVPSVALPGNALPAPERTLWFTFGVKDQLLSVIAVSRDPNVETIGAAFSGTQAALNSQAGTATASNGPADSRTLAEGLLRQAVSEYRFTNYYAVARAANMGTAYVLTEEYRSLPD